MDTLSHGLWGGVMYGRKNRKSFWLAFTFGILPDMLSFGIFTFARIFNIEGSTGFGKPELSDIPQYVHTLYDITHSFVTFALVFGICWAIFKKPIWELFAWAFHIFLDMFTHSTEFFPTPYLWPFSHTRIDGVPWSTPIIFFTNVGFLILIYIVYWYQKITRKKQI